LLPYVKLIYTASNLMSFEISDTIKVQRDFAWTGKSLNSCPAPPRKIFRFSADPNQIYIHLYPVPHRGAFRDRHGRWVRDAMDAAASGTQVLDEGC
jgi:hypothetical protein